MFRVGASLARYSAVGVSAMNSTQLASNAKRVLLPTSKLAGIAPRFCSTGNQYVFEIESVEQFQEHVLSSSTPVLVDFHADWCGPCRVLGPRLEEKVNGRQGEVLLAKINVDYAGELATDYGISAVPTVISFRNGEKVNSFSGVINDDQIDDFIDEAVGN